jgi:hypothetical protein
MVSSSAFQPARVASRGSVSQSGWPTNRASRSNWCSRPTCRMNQPSDARKLSMISSGILPGRTPIDQKLVTTSASETMASSIAMSTY